MLDLERIYDVYLDKLQKKREEDNKEYKEWFGGSSAGSCYKKQLYKITGIEAKPFDTRTKRLLRLGTIVHKDILEEAIDYWKEEYKEIDPDEYDIYTEHEIKIPEFHEIGHLDNCIVEKHEDGTHYITIADLKTLAAYSWTKKFGREAKKKGINVHYTMSHYELQTATYALGMLKQYNMIGDLNSRKSVRDIRKISNMVKLNIVWYNKNDSRLKITEVPSLEALEAAILYWQDLNDFIDETPDDEIYAIPPDGAVGIPMQSWECNYCQYSITCKGS